MSVIQGRTREQIRVAVGRHIGALYVSLMTVNTGTITGTAVNKKDFNDRSLFGGNDDHNGKWLRFTSGSNDGRGARVHDYVGGTVYRVIVRPDVTGANFAIGDTYEMWDSKYNPTEIDEFINQAIIDATGRVYDPEEDITLHADGKTTKFAIPSGFSMLSKVQYRSKVTSAKIHLADSVWTAGTNVTASVDTKLKKEGSGSNKLVLAVGVAAGGVIAYKDITSIDLSKYTHVEWWARCSKTLAASDLKLLLDNTAASVSPIELLAFLALTADVWKFHRVALAKADEDTAIISVGIEDDVDIGAETVWIDGVKAIDANSEVWTTLPNHSWKIDREASELVLSDAARATIGYSLLKLIGGDKPALLTADATACEIDDWYVECRATELAFLAAGEFEKGAFWARLAAEARQAFPILENVRMV